MALEDPQKILLKNTKKYEIVWLSDALTIHPNNFLRPLLNNQSFLSFNFYFGHKTPCDQKTWENYA